VSQLCLGGMPPNPQGRLRRVMGTNISLVKKGKSLLFSYLEKEEIIAFEEWCAMSTDISLVKKDKCLLFSYLEKEEIIAFEEWCAIFSGFELPHTKPQM
jgi:hypothetical protein